MDLKSGVWRARVAAERFREDGMADRPKLLDRVREEVRLRHYSRRTEEAYVGWIRRYIVFHGKRQSEPWLTLSVSRDTCRRRC